MEFPVVLRSIVHYGLHFIAPLLISRLLWRDRWLQASLIMIAANLIDLDHLLADPVFDPARCSIGFHPLHTLWAGALYILIMRLPDRRFLFLGCGLIWHLSVDYLDCLLMGLG